MLHFSRMFDILCSTIKYTVIRKPVWTVILIDYTQFVSYICHEVQGQDVMVVEEFVNLGSQWCLHMLLGIKFGTNLYGMMMYGG